MRGLPAALAFVAMLLPGAAAAADPGTSPKRQTPDYDGRPDPPPTAGEGALWIPRVLLFPPYVVSEYVIRRPLGALVTAAERNNWVGTVPDGLLRLRLAAQRRPLLLLERRLRTK
jgi:hypothetical protein